MSVSFVSCLLRTLILGQESSARIAKHFVCRSDFVRADSFFGETRKLRDSWFLEFRHFFLKVTIPIVSHCRGDLLAVDRVVSLPVTLYGAL